MRLYFTFACVVTIVLLAVVACVAPMPTPPPSVLPSPTVSPLLLSKLSQNESIVRIVEEENSMTADLLAGIFGIVLSLLFSYVPGLQARFDPLDKQVKQMIMGLGIVVIAGAVFGLSCGGIVNAGITCDKSGALGLLSLAIEALIANQGAYSLTKK